MSTRTERSAWSPEEVDSLENIDKEIQLASTSSESYTLSNHPQENGSLSNGKANSNHIPNNETQMERSNKNKKLNSKLFSSCDDLSLWHDDNKHQTKHDSSINRSTTFANFKKNTNHKYDHVQSKIKQYFNNENKKEIPPSRQNVHENKENTNKEDYLEQINKQLTKELDEKNAILSLLQENYEHLLFKYAEAQNRIDELRFKFLTENQDLNGKTNKTVSHFYCDNYESKPPDIKCQKAVVTPFIKAEDPPNNVPVPVINRPSSLPLDYSLKFIDRDMIKATTPTDSEGLSSIITSMSGHSKILNSLDEENQITKKPKCLQYQSNSFILEENPAVNDPFDKVKNWQNSLPPLEQIETPETTLYNVFGSTTGPFSSPDTKYKEIPSPKVEKSIGFSDESCPDSWKEPDVTYSRLDSDVKKISSRALSLPNTSPKQSILVKKAHHSLETPEDIHHIEPIYCKKETTSTPKNDVPSGCIIQRRQKRPPLLRCSSLPAYDHDSVNSGCYKNGIYIPPLDLTNVTLSDDESYCQQEFYLSKSNAVTSSSFVTSRGGSIDRSIQTPQSFSSCKATISDENSYPRVPKQTISKSTSITPERSRAMDLFVTSNSFRRKTQTQGCIKECGECCSDKSQNWCNVCGESISEGRPLECFSKNKSNSCESIRNGDVQRNDITPRRLKPPFKRSVSFGSDPYSPKYCSQEDTPRNFSSMSHDSLENVDVYTKNLRARSQVVIKALTAHVNSCTQ